MDMLSLIISIVSLALAAVAIWIAIRESKKSTENYQKTEKVLTQIENKAEAIDRSVQKQEIYLLDLVRKAMDKMGQPPIEPLSVDEVNDILYDKTTEAHIQNNAGGDTVIIGNANDIGAAIAKELKDNKDLYKEK